MHETTINHDGLGAVTGDFGGRTVVLHYGDIAAEYRSVRTGVGLCDLSQRGKLHITGPDRQRFLHRMVTNDVERLCVGEGVYACMLTPQGKIVSDMTIYSREDDLLIDVEPGMAGILRETLDRYALIDDIEIEDATARYGLIGVCGRKAETCLKATVGLPDALPSGGNAEIEWNGLRMTVTRSHRTGERDYDLYVPAENADETWKALLADAEASSWRPVGYDALEVLRVEAGIPRCNAELDDRIIPNEAVKDRAVSFAKGCYIGQEPVVMMEHRGRPNRLLSGLAIAGDTLPERNAVIRRDGQDAGWVTTAVRGRGVRGIIALGFVRRRYRASGGPVDVMVNGGLAGAEIVDLPFVDLDPH